MERLTWKQIYELWEADNLLSYFDINDPLDCEIVKVDCKPGFYVYQYGWAAICRFSSFQASISCSVAGCVSSIR